MKKLFCVMVLATLLLSLVGCGTSHDTEQQLKERFTFEGNLMSDTHFAIITDNETGVQYLYAYGYNRAAMARIEPTEEVHHE